MLGITTFPPVSGVDSDNYYSKTEVELLIASGGAGGTIDLSNYYKKLETYSREQVDALISSGTGNLSDYYTKAQVDSLIANIDVDLSNYYNKTEVDGKDNEIYAELAFKLDEVDTKLSTKVDKVANSSLVADTKVISYDSHIASTSNPHNTTANQVGAYSKTEVDNLLASIPTTDLSGYYTKTETYNKTEVDNLIPDISSKQDVLVSATNIKTINGESILGSGDLVISGGGDVDLSEYYKKTETYSKVEVDTKISDIPTTDLSNYYDKTETYNKTEVDNLIDNIPETDLSGYYNKVETETLLSNKVDKEVGKGLSTNDFTDTFKQALELNKVQNITTNSVTKKLVVTYTNGTSVDLNLDDVITDVKVESATLDATTNVLTILSSDGGADVTVDLSVFVTNQTLNNALVGKADKIHTHSTSDIDGLDIALSNKVTKNEAIVGATKTKITYDSNGLVTGGVDLSTSDIPNLPQSKIINLETNLSSKIDKGVGVVGATKTKITYNNDGIITGGADLAEADLPDISQAKITNLVTDLSNKQEILVSGTNIKTINGQSVLGSGDIEITTETDLTNYYTKSETDSLVGDKGDTGDTGNGIVNILFTSTTDTSGLAGQSGATDTYTITYSDTTTDTIQLYNGLDSAVQSVAGRVGNVILTEADITDIDKYTKAEVDAKINAKHSTAYLMAYSN